MVVSLHMEKQIQKQRWKIELPKYRVFFTCFPRDSEIYTSFCSTPCFSSSSPIQANLKYLYHVCPVTTSVTCVRQQENKNLKDIAHP